MANSNTAVLSTAITAPIPPKDTIVKAIRDNIDLYYEMSVNPTVKALFADDSKVMRPYRKDDIVGSVTGKTLENKYGVWIEVTVRYWRQRFLDKVREDTQAYYLLHQDPVTWDGYQAQKQEVIKQNTVPAPEPKGDSIKYITYFAIGIGALLLLRGRNQN